MNKFIIDEYTSESVYAQLNTEVDVSVYLPDNDKEDYSLYMTPVKQFLEQQIDSNQKCHYIYVRIFNLYVIVVGLYNCGNEQVLIERSKEIYNFLSESISKQKNCYSIFSPLPYEFPHLMVLYSSILICSTMYQATREKKYVELCSSKPFIESLDKFLNDCYVENIHAFRVYPGGEYDTRSTYCAVVLGYALNLLNKDYFQNTYKYFENCVCYDGGITGVPGNEAHSAYTFCGLAGLTLLGKEKTVYNTKNKVIRLITWINNRQMEYEGGFNGRPNKLVDTCYSFWCGASAAIASELLSSYSNNVKKEKNDIIGNVNLYYNRQKLLKYINYVSLVQTGGLRDKPGAVPDAYHTFYGLGGYLITKNNFIIDVKTQLPDNQDFKSKPISPYFNTPAYAVQLFRETINGQINKK